MNTNAVEPKTELEQAIAASGQVIVVAPGGCADQALGLPVIEAEAAVNSGDLRLNGPSKLPTDVTAERLPVLREAIRHDLPAVDLHDRNPPKARRFAAA